MGGSFPALQIGLPNIVDKVHEFIEQPWFVQWGSSSNAGSGSIVATQMAPGKGYGKPGEQAMSDFNGWGNGGSSFQHSGGSVSTSAWDGLAPPQGLDVVAGALSSLPPSIADSNNKSQCISFTCPVNCVSAVIGKGGAGTKEISVATGAKIMIREI